MKPFISFFLFPFLVWAGPLIVGNGNGESEFHLLLSQQQIHFFWKLCQARGECRQQLDAKESAQVLLQIEAVGKTQIVFQKSDLLQDRLFEYVVNEHQILINQDLLWTKDQRALSLTESLEILLQIVQSQAQISQTSFDRFSRSLIPLVEAQMRQTSVPHLGFEIRILNFRNGTVVFSLNKGQEILEVQTLAIEDSLVCPQSHQKPNVVQLKNLNYSYRIDQPTWVDFILSSGFQMTCDDRVFSGQVSFNLRLVPQHETFHFNLSNMRFTQSQMTEITRGL